MSFAEHDNMIEAVLADGTDQPLRIRVLPGRSRRGGAIANAHGLQPPTHGMAIGRIAVSDQVTRGLIPREGVTDLPRDPLRNPYRRACRRITKAYSSRNPMVGTTRKSIAAIPAAWLRRKVLQVWDDGRPPLTMYLATVVSPTSMPSLSSSPCWGGRHPNGIDCAKLVVVQPS